MEIILSEIEKLLAINENFNIDSNFKYSTDKQIIKHLDKAIKKEQFNRQARVSLMLLKAILNNQTKINKFLFNYNEEEQDKNDNDYLSVHEIADNLGLGIASIRNYIKQNKLKALKIGREYKIKKSDYQEFLKSKMKH